MVVPLLTMFGPEIIIRENAQRDFRSAGIVCEAR